jgi:hypothetical protein
MNNTPVTFKIEGVKYAKIYHQMNRPPDGWLGWLQEFNHQHQHEQPAAKMAQLLRHSVQWEALGGEFKYFGVVPYHHRGCHEYILHENGSVSFFSIDDL